MSKGQTGRLTVQHISLGGASGIFGEDAQVHDKFVGAASSNVFKALQKAYPNYEFRFRQAIRKQEINEKLRSIDARLGETLFVKESKIKPDGGVIEVLDKDKKWRVILVSEAKFQGKDIENIKIGMLVGKNNTPENTPDLGPTGPRLSSSVLSNPNLKFAEGVETKGISPSESTYVVPSLEKANGARCRVKPGDDEWNLRQIPNFCGDLNAFAEAYKTLTSGEKKRYSNRLMDITMMYPVGCVPDYERDLINLADLTNASALDKCRALYYSLTGKIV